MKMYVRIPMVIMLVLILHGLTAQSYIHSLDPKAYPENFLLLSKKVDSYYDTATGPRRSGYKQWKRSEWFALNHLDASGKIPDWIGKNEVAMEAAERMTANDSRSPAGDWFSIGHGSVAGAEARMGRVNSVAFDPVDPAIIYVATTGGGMWKSTNHGTTWFNLTVDLPVLGISDIVVSPAPNNHIVYALTGDIAGAGYNIYQHSSIGVIKSYNGGLSWTRTNFISNTSQGLVGYKLLMHPTNPDIIYAATTVNVRKTTNGGLTWSTTAMGNINDIEFKPGNPNIIYFSKKNENNFYIWDVSANSISMTPISTNLAIDRMEIGVTPHNPNAVYILCGPGYNFFGAALFNGLFYSGNSGSSFTMRTNLCNDNNDLFNSNSSLSDYANTIYVDPFNENYIVIGGLGVYNSVNGGVNLAPVNYNSIHADQHNIKRNPLNGHLWLCNDGGVYRSTDSGNTWESKSNGLVINEYYRISGTNDGNDRLIGGTQDNGHFLRVGPNNFQHVMGGDGMDNYFNSLYPEVVYASSQNGGLRRSSNFGNNFSGVPLPNEGDDGFYPWITSIVQHPPFFNSQSGFWFDVDILYVYSFQGIQRSTDGGATWQLIPLALGQAGPSPPLGICRDVGGTNLYVSNGINFWTCIDPLATNPAFIPRNLPIGANTFISAMAVNPANRNEVWVAITGYIEGVKIFRTLNAGISWQNLSLSLPNVPVYSIVFGNNTNSPSGAVYIGTEIGVFYTNDNLPDWIAFSNGIPHAPVTDLQINYANGTLKDATFGRGIWQCDLNQVCSPTVLVDFEINQGQYSFESSNTIHAYHWITGGLGANVKMKAQNRITFLNGFHAWPDTYLHAKIGGCGSALVTFQGSIPVIDPVEINPVIEVKINEQK